MIAPEQGLQKVIDSIVKPTRSRSSSESSGRFYNRSKVQLRIPFMKYVNTLPKDERTNNEYIDKDKLKEAMGVSEFKDVYVPEMLKVDSPSARKWLLANWVKRFENQGEYVVFRPQDKSSEAVAIMTKTGFWAVKTKGWVLSSEGVALHQDMANVHTLIRKIKVRTSREMFSELGLTTVDGIYKEGFIPVTKHTSKSKKLKQEIPKFELESDMGEIEQENEQQVEDAPVETINKPDDINWKASLNAIYTSTDTDKPQYDTVEYATSGPGGKLYKTRCTYLGFTTVSPRMDKKKMTEQAAAKAMIEKLKQTKAIEKIEEQRRGLLRIMREEKSKLEQKTTTGDVEMVQQIASSARSTDDGEEMQKAAAIEDIKTLLSTQEKRVDMSKPEKMQPSSKLQRMLKNKEITKEQVNSIIKTEKVLELEKMSTLISDAANIGRLTRDEQISKVSEAYAELAELTESYNTGRYNEQVYSEAVGKVLKKIAEHNALIKRERLAETPALVAYPFKLGIWEGIGLDRVPSKEEVYTWYDAKTDELKLATGFGPTLWTICKALPSDQQQRFITEVKARIVVEAAKRRKENAPK